MIAIASDHGGYQLKEHLKAYLAAKGITCEDFGTDSTDSCDYPVFGRAAAQAVASGRFYISFSYTVIIHLLNGKSKCLLLFLGNF